MTVILNHFCSNANAEMRVCQYAYEIKILTLAVGHNDIYSSGNVACCLYNPIVNTFTVIHQIKTCNCSTVPEYIVIYL